MADHPASAAQSGTQASAAQSGTQASAAQSGTQASAAQSGTQASAAQSGAAAAVAESRPNRRKVREGIVVSAAMDKTAVVAVVERVRHARYAKTMQRTKRIQAHDEPNDARVGDRVRVAETRPLSKMKRWRVVEILERAK